VHNLEDGGYVAILCTNQAVAISLTTVLSPTLPEHRPPECGISALSNDTSSIPKTMNGRQRDLIDDM
jgi:hypothetical protein